MNKAMQNMQKYTRYGYTSQPMNEFFEYKEIYFEDQDKLLKGILASRELWRPVTAEYLATHTTKKSQAREPLEVWLAKAINRYTDQWSTNPLEIGDSYFDECRLPCLKGVATIYVLGGHA
jgi:hypothetical protein